MRTENIARVIMSGATLSLLTAIAVTGCGNKEQTSERGQAPATSPAAPQAASVGSVASSRVPDKAPEPVVVQEPIKVEEPQIQEEVFTMPTTYRGAIRVGLEQRDAGNVDRAIEVFEWAAERVPHLARPHIEIARMLVERGEFAQARERAEHALELDATSSSAWNTLGRIELAEGDLDAAAVSFTRAGEENPNNSYAWNNLGYVLIEQQRYDAAVAALERATSGHVVTDYMWNNLGMAYEHLNRVKEARSAYGQAADAGSALAAANAERLVGVESIVGLAAKEPADAADDLDLLDDDEGSELIDVAATPSPIRE